MPTVIDSLVLELALDPTKFTAGQKSAMEALRKLEEQSVASGKEVEAQGKRIVDFFTNLKREAIGLVAAFYGGKGIAEVVEHVATLDASIGRAARNFGTSAPKLAIWVSILRQIGSTAEAAIGTVQGLSETFADFAVNPAHAPAGFFTTLQRIGVSPNDYAKPDVILDALARYAQRPDMKANVPGFRAMGRLLGVGPDVLTAVTDPNFEHYRKNAENLALTNEKTAAAAAKLVEDFSLLEQASESLARLIGIRLIPNIEKITSFLEKLLGGKTTAQDVVELDQSLGGAQVGAAWDWVKSLFSGHGGSQTDTLPPGKGRVLRTKDTGIGGILSGDWIAEVDGQVIAGSGNLTGAKGAAAASAVHNRWHHRTSNWSNATHIGSIHVNAPNAKDAKGVAGGIHGALNDSISAPLNSWA